MANVGRPPKFKSAEEMQEKIDKYFEECDGILARDKDGELITNKKGELQYIKPPHPPTMTGLAFALGFRSRQTLLNYKAKKEFMDTLTCARMRVEVYTEERLFDKDGCNGAKFSLANNFEGWKEKLNADIGIKEPVKIIDDIPRE